MKKLSLILAILMLLVTGCGYGASWSTTEPIQNFAVIYLTYNHRDGIASNQFAVWIEDNDGNMVKTLFVTRFTAKGGWKNRPEAIPVWVEKSGIKNGTADAHSGATPTSGQLSYIWDCTDENGQPVPAGDYRFIVEGTIFWQDAVTYTGTITIGGGKNTAQAEASYTSEDAKMSDMITDVKADYTP